MSDRIFIMEQTGEPEHGAPPADKIVSGNPTNRTWNLEDDGNGLYAGYWESTPGEWKVEYAEWEFCHIISGHSVITHDSGVETVVKAGDALVLRPGMKGTWRVVETTLKHYVIKT